MERISVSVRIPALGNCYDFTVPDRMSVKDAKRLMVRILHSEYGVSNQSEDVALFDMADGTMLRTECSFAQLGIADGAKLMMM